MRDDKVTFFEIILFIGGLIWVFTTNNSETFWTISISLSLMFLAKSYLIFKGKKDKSIDSKYLNENEEYNNKSKIKGEYTIVYLIDKHGYEHRYSIEESEIPKKWIDLYDDIEIYIALAYHESFYKPIIPENKETEVDKDILDSYRSYTDGLYMTPEQLENEEAEHIPKSFIEIYDTEYQFEREETEIKAHSHIFEFKSDLLYMNSNGVTIKAKDEAKAGTESELNGKKYKIVSEIQLREMIMDRDDISDIVTSKITNMKEIFEDVYPFNQDISSWDVSNVTNMESMFSGVDKFNGDISSWDVSNVTNMKSMFFGAEKFNQDISSWDLSNVTNMDSMFYDARKFNQDISSWDVSNVTNMEGMFMSTGEFNQDISNWNVSNVINMSYLFLDAEGFNVDISSWDVSNVISMVRMFCSARKFNQDISNWDVSNVTNMEGMFMSTEEFNQDISNWDVSNVTNMTEMFDSSEKFNQDLSMWEVHSLKEFNQFSFEASSYKLPKPKFKN